MIYTDMPDTFDGLPLITGWELTLSCDLRCVHCGSTAGKKRKNELTTKEALSVCDQLTELLVQEVDFTGGEPLIRKDWPIIAIHLKKAGVTLKMVTNGIHLDSTTVTTLKDVEIDGIGVSIDGIEPVHDYIRGRGGLFQQIMQGIERVHTAEIPLTVITTVHALNVHQLPELMETLVAEGIKYWRLQPIFPFGRGSNDELPLSLDEFLKLGEFVKESTSLAKKKGLTMRTGDACGFYTELDISEPPWRGCSAGLFSLGIASDGKIKGCLSMPDSLIEGDLRKNDLWSIWFDPNVFSYNRKFSEDQLGPSCTGCEYGKQCLGGCTAMSFACTTQFHNDPYCFHSIKLGLN